MEPVSFPFGEVVQDRGRVCGWVIFPQTAVLCVRATDIDGEGCEVGTIGNEGASGVQSASGTRALRTTTCQVAGTGLRMIARIFSEFREELPHFAAAIGAAEKARSFYTEQLAACNALHVLDQRTSRWLLLLADRTNADRFAVTHEYLAAMLGVRRPAITLAESRLQAAGAITYRYGLLCIRDRSLLETLACECYREIADVFDASLRSAGSETLLRTVRR